MSQPTTAQEPVSCLSIALEYINGGLDVTPVLSPTAGTRGAGKAPYLPEWQSIKRTAFQFEQLWRKGSNIGVITGKASELVCIDIDRAAGMAWYYEHKDSLPSHITERRGATSLHLWFRYPHDAAHVPSKVGLFPGVDFSADGKQVVTWPSIHRSGDPYTIDNGLTLLDVQHECDECPGWILALVNHSVIPNTSVDRIGGTASTQDFDRCAWRITELEPAITGNAGDMRTYQAACVCHDYGLSEAQAYELLESVYNPRCSPPWEASELREKVRNAYKYASGTLGASTGAAGFSEPLPADIDAQIEEHKVAASYSLKRPIASAQAYLARNPNQTLCASNQLYRYSAADKCWQIIKDEQFKSVLLADLESADPGLHNKAKMMMVGETTQAIKRILEGSNPDRELKPDTWLDGRPGHFIACKNGILNIVTGELVPHSPEWFSFTSLEFGYDAEATCPVFEGFLNSIWDNDKELKESLRAWIGYVLIDSMKQQKFAVFKGASRAGKGTVVRVIEGLVGRRNFLACSMNIFGSDFGLEPFIGRRLAIFNDAEAGSGSQGHVATERIKSIVGNDSVSINRKGNTILTMSLPTKLMLVCNKIPPFVNDQNAMTNRMIGFPFDKSFQGKEDRDLGDKLREELPGIFNWALEGSRVLLRGELLAQSASGRALVDEIGDSLDSVRCFVKEALRFTGGTHNRVTNDQLWAAYKSWCEESNQVKKSRQGFFTLLGPLVKDNAQPFRDTVQRGYIGMIIEVKDAAPFDELDDCPF
jgi:P4 family phage/plasmid primase-like protien